MGDAGPRLAMPHDCDAAALHPDLRGQEVDDNLFRACARLQNALKATIKSHLRVEADLFLVANTSHALTTAIAGLALDGFALEIDPPSYPAYDLVPPWPTSAVGLRNIALVTHVDPLTGGVASLPRGGARPIVIDAAQSFATLHHHAAALSADVFLAPLHKHAGIAAGLGLIGIRPDAPLPALRRLADIGERGTSSRLVLEGACATVEACDGRIVNRAVIELSPDLRRLLKRRGISPLTPYGASLPFVCLHGVDTASLCNIGEPGPLSFKLFPRENILRVSANLRGHLGDEAVDLSAAAERALADASSTPRPSEPRDERS